MIGGRLIEPTFTRDPLEGCTEPTQKSQRSPDAVALPRQHAGQNDRKQQGAEPHRTRIADSIQNTGDHRRDDQNRHGGSSGVQADQTGCDARLIEP